MLTVAGAPGVAWSKDLAGETRGGGVLVFTAGAAISLANDITLEAIPISRVVNVARLLRPLPPTTTLPPPRYDRKRLLAACAERAPGEATTASNPFVQPPGQPFPGLPTADIVPKCHKVGGAPSGRARGTCDKLAQAAAE